MDTITSAYSHQCTSTYPCQYTSAYSRQCTSTYSHQCTSTYSHQCISTYSHQCISAYPRHKLTSRSIKVISSSKHVLPCLIMYSLATCTVKQTPLFLNTFWTAVHTYIHTYIYNEAQDEIRAAITQQAVRKKEIYTFFKDCFVTNLQALYQSSNVQYKNFHGKPTFLLTFLTFHTLRGSLDTNFSHP